MNLIRRLLARWRGPRCTSCSTSLAFCTAPGCTYCDAKRQDMLCERCWHERERRRGVTPPGSQIDYFATNLSVSDIINRFQEPTP